MEKQEFGNACYEVLEILKYIKEDDLEKIPQEDDSYTDYYAMTCGFKNKKELMKYTKAVIKLVNKLN